MVKYIASFWKLHFFSSMLVSICTGLLVLSAWSLVAQTVSQIGESQNKVVRHFSVPEQPIRIMGVKVAGRDFKLGEGIGADENWLKTLSVKIKNVSSKTIIYTGMYLDFPETKSSGSIMAFPFRFGRNLRLPDPNGEPNRLIPGEATELMLSDQQYARLKNFLEKRHSIAALHAVDIRLVDVDFDDGTIWDGGTLYRIDPNNPRKLVPFENSRTSNN